MVLSTCNSIHSHDDRPIQSFWLYTHHICSTQRLGGCWLVGKDSSPIYVYIYIHMLHTCQKKANPIGRNVMWPTCALAFYFSIYLLMTAKTELWTFTWPLKAVRSLYIQIYLIAFKQPSTVDCITIWFVVGSPSYYLVYLHMHRHQFTVWKHGLSEELHPKETLSNTNLLNMKRCKSFCFQTLA